MKFRGNEVNLWIILEGILWSFFISIIIRFLPLRTIFRIITPVKNKKSCDKDLIINSLNLVLSLENKFIPVKCWKKSMLIFRLLKKYGYESRIHFGVTINHSLPGPASKEKILVGHSWVTVDNIPLSKNDINYSKSLTEILTYP